MMKNQWITKAISVLGLWTISLGFPSSTFAKVRTIHHPQPKFEFALTKELREEASFTLLQSIEIPAQLNSLPFQEDKLKIDEDVDYLASKCYVYLKPETLVRYLEKGRTLKVSKAENYYNNRGTTHLTFWFENDPTLSHMDCITHDKSSLTGTDVNNILGSFFSMSFSKNLERTIFVNTHPDANQKKSLTFEENGNTSTRVILIGS